MTDIEKLRNALKLLDENAEVWEDVHWNGVDLQVTVFGETEIFVGNNAVKEAAKEWRHALEDKCQQLNRINEAALDIDDTDAFKVLADYYRLKNPWELYEKAIPPPVYPGWLRIGSGDAYRSRGLLPTRQVLRNRILRCTRRLRR